MTDVEPKRYNNPVIVLIDQGHYMKTLADGKKTICRSDAEEWPCLPIQKAEAQLRERLTQWQNRPLSIERPTAVGAAR